MKEARPFPDRVRLLTKKRDQPGGRVTFLVLLCGKHKRNLVFGVIASR